MGRGVTQGALAEGSGWGERVPHPTGLLHRVLFSLPYLPSSLRLWKAPGHRDSPASCCMTACGCRCSGPEVPSGSYRGFNLSPPTSSR